MTNNSFQRKRPLKRSGLRIYDDRWKFLWSRSPLSQPAATRARAGDFRGYTHAYRHYVINWIHEKDYNFQLLILGLEHLRGSIDKENQHSHITALTLQRFSELIKQTRDSFNRQASTKDEASPTIGWCRLATYSRHIALFSDWRSQPERLLLIGRGKQFLLMT